MEKLAVGIDIGGTNTKLGLVDIEGNIHAETAFPTSDYPDFDEFVEALHDNIQNMLSKVSPQIELVGIGIGAPMSNNATGTIENAANFAWKGKLPIVSAVKRYYPSFPVLVTNDANAAAIGEMTYGGAKGMTDFIEVTLGTGVGGGLVANGRLIYGYDGFAAELGHIMVKEHGRECACGHRGCLEAYASANGIKRTIFELMADSISPSKFRDITFNDLSCEMVTTAALEGDKLAIEAYEHTGMALGKALAYTVTMTSPEAIFLFGGLAKAGKYILEPTKKYMDEALLPIFRGKVKVMLSELQIKSAAILGASALVWAESKAQTHENGYCTKSIGSTPRTREKQNTSA